MTLRILTLTLASLVTVPLSATEPPADATKLSQPKVVKVVKVVQDDWLLKHPTIQALVQQANAHRARMGVGPVRLNAEMCLAAQRHANWMSDFGGMQHSGLPYMEIIFQGPTTPDGAINGWVASPAHHGIMLSGTEVGFGYQYRNGRPSWVGVFR